MLICIDIRKQDGPLFTLQAHNATLSSLSFSASVPGKFIYLLTYLLLAISRELCGGA